MGHLDPLKIKHNQIFDSGLTFPIGKNNLYISNKLVSKY